MRSWSHLGSNICKLRPRTLGDLRRDRAAILNGSIVAREEMSIVKLNRDHVLNESYSVVARSTQYTVNTDMEYMSDRLRRGKHARWMRAFRANITSETKRPLFKIIDELALASPGN